MPPLPPPPPVEGAVYAGCAGRAPRRLQHPEGPEGPGNRLAAGEPSTSSSARPQGPPAPPGPTPPSGHGGLKVRRTMSSTSSTASSTVTSTVWRSATRAATSIEAAVAALAFLLYVNTLDAGFVYDDSRAVLRNGDATGSSPWSSAFANDFWGTPLSHSGSHGSYRPLTVLSLRLNAVLSGRAGQDVRDSPAGFHLGNVVLHVAASLLVLRLGRRLTSSSSSSSWPAGVAALLFAAHPVHCEAVAGVVGRADLLSAVFFLLAVLCYVRYVDWRELHRCRHASRLPQDVPLPSKDLINVVLDQLLLPRPPSGGAKVGRATASVCAHCSCRSAALLCTSLALAVCATLSKETGATVLGVCFAYEALVQLRRHRHRDLRAEPSRLVALVAFGGALLAARLWLMGMRAPRFALADNPAAHSPSALTRTLTFLHLPAVNAGLLLWPHALSFDWSMDAVPRVQSLADPRNALSLALYVALWRCARSAWHGPGGVASAARSRSRPRAPTRRRRDSNNNDVATKGVIAAPPNSIPLERGEAMLVILALLVLPALPATNLFFYVGFVVAERVLYLPSVGFCLLVALGADRLRHCARHRNAANAMLAVVLVALSARTVLRNRDWHDEEALYRSGIDVNPPKAYGNLGSVLSGLNRLPEAEHAYRMALKHRPNMAEVHYNLGNLLALRRKYEASAESYRSAIMYRPTLALAYVNLGHILAKLGRVQDAIRVFQDCARIPATGLKDPIAHESARASALFHLAHLHVGIGDLAEAKKALEMALRVRPAQYEQGPILKLMAQVTHGLRASAATQEMMEKVLEEHMETSASSATSREGEVGEAGVKTAALLNESRCTTADSHRLLSHS